MIAKQGEDRLEPKLGREGLGCQGKEFGLQPEDDREALEGCKQKCHPEILRLEGLSDDGVDNGPHMQTAVIQAISSEGLSCLAFI